MQPDNKQHRPECLAHQEQQRKRHEASLAWQARWPGHCKRCGGAGGFEHPGDYWEPPDFEECECVGELRCPRCGGGLTEACVADARPCLICGWAWGQNEGDADPGEDEEEACVCHYYEPELELEDATWPPCDRCGKESAHGKLNTATGQQMWLCDDCVDDSYWADEQADDQQAAYSVLSADDRSRDGASVRDPFESAERFAFDYGREAWERAGAAPWAGCPVCGGAPGSCPECS